MNAELEKAATWMYRGVWATLTRCFKVPQQPPSLPTVEGGTLRSFHPSPRFLSYLKLHFWVAITLINLALVGAWVMLYLANPFWAWLLFVPLIALMLIPGIIVYLALHLRYDTMWYVMTDQSLRCRRGIWTIIEHTITFENVQNVDVHRGPLQYFFGISTIVVETAGAAVGEGQNEFAVGNKAILEGIANPKEIRGLIMERVKRSRSGGLGDDGSALGGEQKHWSREDLNLLEEIRDELCSGKRLR